MNKNKLALLLVALFVMLFTGCSSVPLEPKEVSDNAKSFNTPSNGKSGIYVYRDTFVGQALIKDIWIDKKCLGETANKIFFYQAVKGNMKHTIATESEFSPNHLVLETESGKNYYIKQYIKMGLFVGGADLELMEEAEGKEAISNLDMAKKGTCSEVYSD